MITIININILNDIKNPLPLNKCNWILRRYVSQNDNDI